MSSEHTTAMAMTAKQKNEEIEWEKTCGRKAYTLDMSKFIPILHYAWNGANVIFFSPIKSTFTSSFYSHWVESFLVSQTTVCEAKKNLLFRELIIASSSAAN